MNTKASLKIICLLPFLVGLLCACRPESAAPPRQVEAVDEINWLVASDVVREGAEQSRIVRHMEGQTHTKITFTAGDNAAVRFWQLVKSGQAPDLVTADGSSAFQLQAASSEKYCTAEELAALLPEFAPGANAPNPCPVPGISPEKYPGENIYINKAQYAAVENKSIGSPQEFLEALALFMGNKSLVTPVFPRLPVVIDKTGGFEALTHLFGIDGITRLSDIKKWQSLLAFTSGIGEKGAFRRGDSEALTESAFAYIGPADKLNAFHQKAGQEVFMPCREFFTGEGFLSPGGGYCTYLRKDSPAGGRVLDVILKDEGALFSYGIRELHYLKSGRERLPVQKSLNEFEAEPYAFLKQSGINDLPFFGYYKTPYTSALFYETRLPLRETAVSDSISPSSAEGYKHRKAEEEIKEVIRQTLYSPYRIDAAKAWEELAAINQQYLQ